MSRIDDLIAEHCPEGVEFLKVGRLAQVGTGSSDRKDAVEGGEYPFYVRSKDVMRIGSYEFDEEAILIPGEGGIGEIFHYVQGKYALHQRAYRIHFTDDRVDARFAYFYFTANFKRFILQKAVSATVTSIRKPMITDFPFPVPPLEVQRAIVEVLDTFSKLEAELEAELEARKQQYEHYKAALLHAPDQAEFESFRLREVVDILVGFPFKSSLFSADPSDQMLIRGDNVIQGRTRHENAKYWNRKPHDQLDRYELSDGDVVLAMDRPWIPAGLKWAQISRHDLPALLVQRVARLRSNSSKLDQRFLSHIISSAAFTQHVLASQTGNTVPHISSDIIGRFQLCLPSLTEQQRIAKLLDTFDALVNDLTIGLPAELAARRQQYEYYRDKLLTFNELEAAV